MYRGVFESWYAYHYNRIDLRKVKHVNFSVSAAGRLARQLVWAIEVFLANGVR